MSGRTDAGAAFPLVVATVIAAVAVTQRNWTGAVVAVVIGAAAALVARRRSGRGKERR
ncbi:hypothetical protein P8A18_12525 [Streptomyces castrisilvae]|uniref:Uncharacterized protein n=1 Tax=Streptomyces castrisilvae TaxID=3033811 RepID=A0ABY9HJG7_9ACTN|nr:hypothetical protein [Streptomyces sp. Mut1]WLQ34212.1 hypothetical protein P8A18_12525 [Streptomyces sp. Mut1]